MKTKSEPSLYRYCIVRLSTLLVSTLVPALNVLSTTLPDRTALSLVRTNAGPLPGFTCWNSTTDQSCPSMLSTMPFFRSLVEATWGAVLRRELGGRSDRQVAAGGPERPSGYPGQGPDAEEDARPRPRVARQGADDEPLGGGAALVRVGLAQL